MASDAILRSFGDLAAREDVVLNAVEILTATEDQIFNIIGRSVAINTTHIYLTDTLRTAASQAVEESADYTYLANTTPSRKANIVEYIAIPFKVSRTQRLIQHYHGEDELERQTRKALLDWSNATEFDLVRGTLTSGVSGTAPTMSGIIEHTSKATNHTSHTSTTQLVASMLEGLMKAQWTNTKNDNQATDLYMGAPLKYTIDGFTQKTNVVVNAPQIADLVYTVKTYETSFGTLRLHKHRYIQQSSDAHQRLLAIRPDKLAVAFLEKPRIDMELARTGDYDVRAVIGKMTLETRNADACWYADGLVQN